MFLHVSPTFVSLSNCSNANLCFCLWYTIAFSKVQWQRLLSPSAPETCVHTPSASPAESPFLQAFCFWLPSNFVLGTTALYKKSILRLRHPVSTTCHVVPGTARCTVPWFQEPASAGMTEFHIPWSLLGLPSSWILSAFGSTNHTSLKMDAHGSMFLVLPQVHPSTLARPLDIRALPPRDHPALSSQCFL